MKRCSLEVLPPRTRAECIDGPRPCPWTTCRHHLDVERRGRGAMVATTNCALDFAARGGATVGEVARELGYSRERVRQIEIEALRKIGERHQALLEELLDA